MRSLLAIAMAYDNRKPGDATVMAWQESARRGRWTYEDAREAILDHYSRSTAYLMPAHITEFIRAKRQNPPSPHVLEPSPSPPANPEHIRKVIAEVGKRLGWKGRA